MQSLISDLNGVEIEIADLESPSWLLRPIDHAIVSELARSIESLGLLQPIGVRKSNQKYEIVFGNHRLEACKKLGMRKIRALILNFSKAEAFVARIAENLLRNTEIDPVEEAKGYRMLVESGWTINGIGQKIGKSDSYVCRRIGLLERLDGNLLSRISNSDFNYVTPSHMELISLIPDKMRQRELVQIVEAKRLSVRSLENLINSVPLPTKVLVEDSNGDYIVRIPKDFAMAVGTRAGRYLSMYIRGRKMVLEDAYSRKHK